MKRNIKKTAFSVVELSVILLFIGILIVGVVVNKDKLTSKANLTNLISASNNSPVRDMDGLTIWYDVANSDGFKKSEIVEDREISLLKNVSPQNYRNIDVEQTVSANRPKYKLDSNGVPYLDFDGTNDYLQSSATISGHEISYPDQITVFIVQEYRGGDTCTFSWVDHISTNKINLLAAWSDNFIYWSSSNGTPGSGRVVTAKPSNFDNKWNLVTVMRKNSVTTNNGIIKVNGGLDLDYSNTVTDTLGVSDKAFFQLGSYESGTYPFNGGIREFILFKRELSTSEINEVEQYLSNKWDIDLS